MPYSPIITCSVVDTNSVTKALTGDSSVLVRYFSNAKATMSAQAQGGAVIDGDMYLIKNGGATAFGTEHTFRAVSSNVFTFSAADNEGNSARKTLTPTMIDYIRLTCNVVDSRPDAAGNMEVACSGDYFNDSFGLYENTIEVSFRYRVSGDSWTSWRYMTVNVVNNTYYAYYNLSGLDYKTSYDFEFRAYDELDAATASTSKVRSLPIFHWGENDVVFEVPVTFNAGTEGASVPSDVDGDLRIKGNLRLKGDGNFGNYLHFGDGSYCYIAELTDDAMTIKANSVDFQVAELKMNGATAALPEYGEWTPYIPDTVVNYYNVQEGWYCKVGNVVTVGFYIKVRCLSGYEDEEIVIYGLPYNPSDSAAGGGMCSGSYMTLPQNFQCFVAEPGSVITTRAQQCDDTASFNLTTSATGCHYPSSTNIALTLSGTITYRT